MRNVKFLLVAFLVGLICSSCKLKSIVSVNDYYPPTSGRIQIYQTGQNLPDNIVRIGSIVVGESGATPTKKCTYEACLQLIEDEAKKKGAELVYLVKVKEPSIWESTCYNITAEMYRYAK